MSFGAVVLLGGCDVLFGLEREAKQPIDAPAPIDVARDVPADTTVIDAPADARPDAPIDGPVGAVCPIDYGMVNGLAGSYRFINVPVSWETARTDCADDQIAGSTRYTHLAVIKPDPERGLLASTQPTSSWIGASDRKTEMVYLWVTDEPNPNYPPTTVMPGVSPWAPNQPAHAGMADDCVAMNGTADFLELDCTTTTLKAWCECDAFPIDPGNF